MINTAELVERPFRGRDLWPIATDEQAIERFQERIEGVTSQVKSPIHFIHSRHNIPLLHISGEEEYSLVGGRGVRFSSERLSTLDQMRVERSHAQDLLFKAMIAYGFDPDKSHFPKTYNHENKRYEYSEEIIKHPDGTTRERVLYPSKTIKGLEFERVRSFVTETGQTTDVWWNVVDQSARFKVDIPSIFRREPIPAISS